MNRRLLRVAHRVFVCAVATAMAACGCDQEGMPIPMGVCFPTTGFNGLDVTLACMNGGEDGQCTFILESSHPSVAALSQTVCVVPTNTTRTCTMTVSSLVFGTATITALDENGSQSFVGTIRVGGC